MEANLEKSRGRIVVELEGLAPSRSQMEAIGNAVQAAVIQNLQPNKKDGLLIRPAKMNVKTSELTLRLARVLGGGSM